MTPLYIQWTILSLLYHIRLKNPSEYKGVLRMLLFSGGFQAFEAGYPNLCISQNGNAPNTLSLPARSRTKSHEVCMNILNTCADPEGLTGGPHPSLKNQKTIGFLNNTDQVPPRNHKATKPSLNVGPTSHASETPFSLPVQRWPAYSCLWTLPPFIN